MRTKYVVTMNNVLVAFGKHLLIYFTLNSATNLHGKQVINMMACGPKSFFLEHFTMELRKESTANLLEKLLNYKLHLLRSIRKPPPNFVPSRDVEMFDDSDVEVEVVEQHEERQVCTKNEHFINPPMFCFCNDSPSIMVKVHKKCLKTKEFTFAYGCAPHAIHNLCMDLIKKFLGVKHVLKQIIFMVKTLNRRIFFYNYLTSCVWRSSKRPTCSSSSRRPDGAPYFSPCNVPARLRRCAHAVKRNSERQTRH